MVGGKDPPENLIWMASSFRRIFTPCRIGNQNKEIKA